MRRARKERIPATRDGLWMRIRQLKTFEAIQLINETNMAHSTVSGYLKQLVDMGFLSREKKNGIARPYTYHLIKDCGKFRPDIGFNKPNGHQRIWMSLKPLKRFSYKDVSLVACTQKASTKRYLMRLQHAGYLHVVVPGDSKNNKAAVFRLNPKLDTGPRAPQIKRGGIVFDANLNKVVWSPKEGVK